MNKYWYIYGNKYDLTDFLDKHPGGKHILESVKGNNDLTPLFESYHAFADIESIRKTLKKYLIEENVKEMEYTFDENQFYNILKKRIRNYLIDAPSITFKIKANKIWYFKSFLLIVSFIIFYSQAFIIKNILIKRIVFAILSGIFQIMIGFSIMHDASHYALFCRNPKLNLLLSNIWNSFSLWEYNLWFSHHGFYHHSYTGNIKLDPDIKFCQPLLRKNPFDRNGKLFNIISNRLLTIISIFYFFVFPGFFFGQSILYWLFWKRRGTLWKISKPETSQKINLIQIIFSGLFISSQIYNFNILVTLFYIIFLNIAYGFCILPDHDTLSTVNNHNDANQNMDWGEIQVRNSGNFENNNNKDIFCHLFGGINYQIEHHLFPSVCHIHYPKIAPIVKKTCQEFNIPYVSHPNIYTALKDVLKSFILLNDTEEENIIKD